MRASYSLNHEFVSITRSPQQSGAAVTHLQSISLGTQLLQRGKQNFQAIFPCKFAQDFAQDLVLARSQIKAASTDRGSVKTLRASL